MWRAVALFTRGKSGNISYHFLDGLLEQAMNVKLEKERARLQARRRRADAAQSLNGAAGVELIARWPARRFTGQTVAAFWPIGDEIDTRPLINALRDAGHRVCLPVTGRKAKPLTFREFSPDRPLIRGPYGTRHPPRSASEIRPDVVLVPLLAYTARGDRLGYGGGYYDRTLAELKSRSEIYACGLAFSAQKATFIPCEPNDMRLDGIVTEAGFEEFH